MKRKTNKRGISLIVLVITIIVMIILASAIILSLSNSGIIGKANEAKTKTDASTFKEAHIVNRNESLLGEEKTEIEILKETAKDLNMESDFDYTHPLIYTGANDEIKEYIAEEIALKELVKAGYLISVLDGEVYITGLDTEKRDVSKILGINGYKVYKEDGTTPVESGNMTTKYIVKKSEQKVATIVYFGDVDGDNALAGNEGTMIGKYYNNIDRTYTMAQVYAMDLDHDGLICYVDFKIMGNVAGFVVSSSSLQNSKVIPIMTDVVHLSDAGEYVEKLKIAKNNQVTYEMDDTMGEKVYMLELKQEYTYNDLNNYIDKNFACVNLSFYDSTASNEIQKTSTNKIGTGEYIYLEFNKKYEGEPNRVLCGKEYIIIKVK